MVQTIIDGIMIGGSYALVAVGFTLVFGVLRVMNVAHGDFAMLGVFASILVGSTLHMGTLPGTLAAIVVGGLAGVGVSLLVLRRLSNEQTLAVFIATLGLSFFLQHFVARIAGPETRATDGLFSTHYYHVAGASVSNAQLLMLLATLLIAFGLMWAINATSAGRDMRAVAENAVLARVVGINPTRVMALTMMVASAIAAIGGILVTNVTHTASPFLGSDLSFKMFVVALVAGAGSLGGALIAAFSLGVIESIASAQLGSSWQQLTGLLVLIAVLMVRPQGLFGHAARVG